MCIRDSVGADYRGGRLGENHHVLRRVGDFGVAGLVHELGVRLIVLGQAVDLGGDEDVYKRQPQPIDT